MKAILLLLILFIACLTTTVSSSPLFRRAAVCRKNTRVIKPSLIKVYDAIGRVIGGMFEGDYSARNPPINGAWRASEIVSDVDNSGGLIEHIGEIIGDKIESALDDPNFDKWSELESAMRVWAGAIKEDTIPSDDIHFVSGNLQGYKKVYKKLIAKGRISGDTTIDTVKPVYMPTIRDENITPEQAAREFATIAKDEISDKNILPDDGTGYLYSGVSDIDDAIDKITDAILDYNLGFRGLKLFSETTVGKAYFKFIQRKLVKLVNKKPSLRGDREVISWERLLNKLSETSTFGEMSRVGIKIDIRNSDSVASVLRVDTYKMAKQFTGSKNIVPNDEILSVNGEIQPKDLYDGANTIENADAKLFDRLGAELSKGEQLSENKKQILRRIITNTQKISNELQDRIQESIDAGDPISEKDIANYEASIAYGEKLLSYKVDLKDTRGDVGDEDVVVYGMDSSNSKFPSFSSKVTKIRSLNYRKYSKIVKTSKSVVKAILSIKTRAPTKSGRGTVTGPKKN